MILKLLKLIAGKIPGQVIIQITNYCNGSCPQCGMRKGSVINRCNLPEEKIKRTVKQCVKNGMEAVSFTGGEPFINMTRLFDLLDFAGKAGVQYLRTGTNGYMFAGADMEKITAFAKQLSATKVRNFWISLDSADTEVHENRRGLPGVIEGIKKALPIFHEHGLYPASNLGINRNISGKTITHLEGEHDIERFLNEFKAGFAAFFQKAIDIGFTMTNVCYPMSSSNEEITNAAYGAISDEYAVNFSKEELKLVFKALMETISEFRDKIRIFTPLSVLYVMSKGDESLLFPCYGGIRYFYMDSRDGHVYPCGFLGEKDLGDDLDKAIKNNRKEKPHCFKCHWECFRDPSQLFGLARYVFWHPIKTLIRKKPDPVMLKLWREDIKYYIKHKLFSGRVPFKK